MEMFIIVVVGLILGWNAIKALFSVLAERSNIWALSNKTGLQENYRELMNEVKETKKASGGKWFTLDDVLSEMKSDN